MYPEFVVPSPDEYDAPDDAQAAITELLSSIDWAIARLTSEVEGLHGQEALELQRECTLRIRALTELNGSLRMAAAPQKRGCGRSERVMRSAQGHRSGARQRTDRTHP